jgi:replication factor C small subunit
MLWTEKYRPHTLEEIIGQEQVIDHLLAFAQKGSVPHLILTGKHGTGKTSAIQCLAKRLYGENWQMNTSVFQTADLFLQGKNYLEQEERYAHLFRKQAGLLANFKYITKSYAAMRPLDSSFKLMVFEDAHRLTREAQQALRRIMERTSGTCRFILSTTNPSAILPAISSRCLPLFFAPIESGMMERHLVGIRQKEIGSRDMHRCNDDHVDLIVQASRGDLRRAIMLLQLAMQSGKKIDLAVMDLSETATTTAATLAAVRNGDVRKAKHYVESLMIESGLSGQEVLSEIRAVAHREYNHPDIAIALADADARIRHCNNEFIQLGAMLTEIRGVFT